LTEARLAEQVAAIKQLNASGKFTTHVFSGTECDILPDGRLDFADLVLAELDYVVVSVHSSFKQSRERHDDAASSGRSRTHIPPCSGT